jgi:hypothetical protein
MITAAEARRRARLARRRRARAETRSYAYYTGRDRNVRPVRRGGAGLSLLQTRVLAVIPSDELELGRSES